MIPESVNRVKKITGKDVTFYKVDLLDKEGLREVFRKVTRRNIANN